MLDQGDDRLASLVESVAAEARSGFASMFHREPEQVDGAADMRYVGQSHELEIPARGAWKDITRSFHSNHRERFGFDRPEEAVEVVNLRAVATGKAPITWSDLPPAPGDTIPVGTDGVWERKTLPAGFETHGPGVVVEENSATLLEEGNQLGKGRWRSRYDSCP